MQIGGYLSPDEFWAMIDAQDQVLRDTLHEAPIYELADWPGPAMVGEWGFHDGPRGLHYRQDDQAEPIVVVETAAEHPRPAEPPDRLVDTTIDGVPIVLEVWEQSGTWWGLGTIRDRAVVIESRGPSPEDLKLRQLIELEPYLGGRRAMIRRMRNE